MAARFLDRVTTVFSVVACLGLPLRLSDTPRSVLIERPAVPLAPESPEKDRAVLSVRTLDGASAPLRRVRITAYSRKEGRYFQAGLGETDDAGRLTLRALPRGVLMVLAEAPGFARRSAEVVADAAEQQLTLRLARAHALEVSVRDDEGVDVPRATVLVHAEDRLPFGALTDASGRARFERLPEAPYRASVSAPGYESVTVDQVRGELSVTLRALGSIEVRVRDDHGAPVSRATVEIVGTRLYPAHASLSDADGNARIRGLLAGSYDLRAHLGNRVSDTFVGFVLERGAHEVLTLVLHEGRMIEVLVTDNEPEPAAVAAADVVLSEWGLSPFPLRARTGEDGRVTLGPIAVGPASVLARAEGFVPRAAVPVPDDLEGPLAIRLLRAATLKGQVVDVYDRPVDGASIEVIGTDTFGLPINETPLALSFSRAFFDWSLSGPRQLIMAGELGVMPGPVPPITLGAFGSEAAFGAAFQWDFEDAAFKPWVTGLDGRFAAYPVTPGKVCALVRHPDYVEAVSELVTLGPGGEASVKVVLFSGGFLSGRVVDALDRPVADARVDLVATRGLLQRTLWTLEDGRFAFAAVPSELELNVTGPDAGSVMLKKAVSVPEGERVELTLTLDPEREPLRVVVVDEDDRPVAGAQITVASLDPQRVVRRTLFSATDGEVAFEQVRGLPLSVRVEAQGWLAETHTFPSAPELFTLTLERGSKVEGTVTAVRGRHALAEASVTLTAGGTRKHTLTDAFGRYHFEHVPGGELRLEVSHPDYATRELGVALKPSERADRAVELPEVDLEEPGAIQGEVVDEQGRPVAGARVALGVVAAYLPSANEALGTVTSDEQGRFELGGLSPGAARLQAYSATVGRGEATASVVAGRTTESVRIVLSTELDDEVVASAGGVAVTLGERGQGSGLEVALVHVAAGSEAERAGLEVGDVLRAVDGVAVTSMSDARARLNGTPGDSTLLELERAGRALRLRVVREAIRR